MCEVGSGLNGKWPKLRRILSDLSASLVVVEYRVRLARLGVEHLEAACARRYGRRGARGRAMRAVTAAKAAEPAGVVAGG